MPGLAVDLIGQQVGNYVARAELGKGGMGVVYLCEHPLIHRKVAAKVLHEELAVNEEMVQRLYQEARAASEIESEHVVEVLDFGRLKDARGHASYLVMEYLDGESLGQRLCGAGLSFGETLHVARQCCEALASAHRKGIVHRDLKPENIYLVDRHGDPLFVKILDFGIAKITADPSTRTRTGVLLGTPAYMSPEQCRGRGTIDRRSDVYSLGVVLFEMLTGTVPFAAEGYGDVLIAHMKQPAPEPSLFNAAIPPVLDAVVLRALQKEREQRFQSMEELSAALDAARASLERPADAMTPTGVPHARPGATTQLGLGASSAAGATLGDVEAPATLRDGEGSGSASPRGTAADTLQDSPALAMAPTMSSGTDLHARATLLGSARPADPQLHQRKTEPSMAVVAATELHSRPTQLRPVAAQVAGPAPSSPPSPGSRPTAAASPPGAHRRLLGVALTEVVEDTGQLERISGRSAGLLDDDPEIQALRMAARRRLMIGGAVLVLGLAALVAAVALALG